MLRVGLSAALRRPGTSETSVVAFSRRALSSPSSGGSRPQNVIKPPRIVPVNPTAAPQSAAGSASAPSSKPSVVQEISARSDTEPLQVVAKRTSPVAPPPPPSPPKPPSPPQPPSPPFGPSSSAPKSSSGGSSTPYLFGALAVAGGALGAYYYFGRGDASRESAEPSLGDRPLVPPPTPIVVEPESSDDAVDADASSEGSLAESLHKTVMPDSVDSTESGSPTLAPNVTEHESAPTPAAAPTKADEQLASAWQSDEPVMIVSEPEPASPMAKPLILDLPTPPAASAESPKEEAKEEVKEDVKEVKEDVKEEAKEAKEAVVESTPAEQQTSVTVTVSDAAPRRRAGSSVSRPDAATPAAPPADMSTLTGLIDSASTSTPEAWLEAAKSHVADLERELARLQSQEAILKHDLAVQEKVSVEKLREMAAELDNVRRTNERVLAKDRARLEHEFDAKLSAAVASKEKEIISYHERRSTLKMSEERMRRTAEVLRLQRVLKEIEGIARQKLSELNHLKTIRDVALVLECMQHAATTGAPFQVEKDKLTKALMRANSSLGVTAIDAISHDIAARGIPTMDQLVERFNGLKAPVRQAAYVGPNGGLLSHMLSYGLSFLSRHPTGLVAGTDVESILSRANYYLDIGDVDSATREMNQLPGWAHHVASDWLKDARDWLEFHQAIQVVQADCDLARLTTIPVV